MMKHEVRTIDKIAVYDIATVVIFYSMGVTSGSLTLTSVLNSSIKLSLVYLHCVNSMLSKGLLFRAYFHLFKHISDWTST